MTAVPPEGDAPTNGSASPSSSKSLPTQRLPTPRIAFQRQLDILRAYAAKSEDGKRTVTNEDVAEIVGMSKDTVTLANAFFADLEVLTKSGDGYLPSSEVLNYLRVHQWDPDKAPLELAPKLRESWFAKTLLSRLTYAPMSEADALTELAKAASAGPSYRQQLETLLDYLAIGGLIVRENGMVQAAGPQASKPNEPRAAGPGADPPPAQPPAAPVPRAPTGGQLPLLVQGLLQQLPTEPKWTGEGADAWLKLARNIFEVVYGIPAQENPGGGP